MLLYHIGSRFLEVMHPIIIHSLMIMLMIMLATNYIRISHSYCCSPTRRRTIVMMFLFI